MKQVVDLSFIEWLDDGQIPQRLYPDIIQTYSGTATAQLTTHPIETGANIVDHYRPDTTVLAVTAIFADTPLRGDLSTGYPGGAKSVQLNYAPEPPAKFAPTLAAVSAVEGLLGLTKSRPETIEMITFDSPPKRGAEAWSTFLDMRDKARILRVKLPIGEFFPVMLVSVEPSQNSDGDMTTFALSFQEVQYATTDTVPVLSLEPRAQKKHKVTTLEEIKIEGADDRSRQKKVIQDVKAGNLGAALDHLFGF